MSAICEIGLRAVTEAVQTHQTDLTEVHMVAFNEKERDILTQVLARLEGEWKPQSNSENASKLRAEK
jgi:hypothetical protein